MTAESASSDPSRQHVGDRLPWSLVAAALVAMAAHYLTSGEFLGHALFAALLVASQLVSAETRLPRSRAVSWSIRIILLTLITILIGIPDESAAQWYMKPAYTDLVGALLASEVALRAWERHERRKLVESRGVMLVLTAGIFAMASNTQVRTQIHNLAPAFALLLVFAVRSFTRSPAARTALVTLRGAVVVLAVAVGFVVVSSVTAYEQRVTQWAIDVLGARRSGRATELGLSGSPRMQAVWNPQASMARVMLIDGPRGERHLRAVAFDTLDGRQWRPALRDRQFSPAEAQTLRTTEPGERLTFTRIGETLDLLLLPPNAAAVEAPRALERDELSSVRDREVELLGAASRYEVLVPPNERFQGPAVGPPIDDVRRQRSLVIPDGLDRKVTELAKQVAGDGDDPHTKLIRLVQHLRSNHQYSLVYDPGDADPLSDFILNRRAAHCQYFAAALVVMSRAVGVPARFVTGYYAHEPYGDGRTVVRQRDAHAWAECWVDGAGWLTLDATPAGGRPVEQFAGASGWRRFWERVGDVPGMIRDWVAQFSRQTLVTLIITGAGVVLLASAVRFALMMRRRRRAARSAAYDGPADQAVIAAAVRFERWLRRTGKPCTPNRTWREHVAQALSGQPTCLEFVDAYDAARFGGGNGELLPRLGDLLDRLESRPARVPQPNHEGLTHG